MSQDVLKDYEELKAHWGDKLVDFEHYPKIFAYQVRIWKYYRDLALQDDLE
jgi:hypothetical protein